MRIRASAKWVCCVLFTIVSVSVQAQESQEEAPQIAIFVDGSGGAGVVAFAEATAQTFRLAGASGQQAPLLSRAGFGGPTQLLMNPQIHQELDLLDEQIAEIREVQREFSNERREFYAALQEMAPERRAEFMREFGPVLNENLQERMEAVLLPRQRTRLQQLYLQTQLRGGGGSLQNEQFAELLGITDEQREELQKKQIEVQERLVREIERLRREAVQEVISVLEPEQQDKLEELLGQEFDWRRPSRPTILPRGNGQDP